MACVARWRCGEFEEAARVELRHQHRRAAPAERRQEADQRRVRIERGGDHRHRIAKAGAGVAADMRPAHRVALHDALGRAGGARGIDDVERIVGRRLRRGRGLRRSGVSHCLSIGVKANHRGLDRLIGERCAAIASSTNTIGAPQSAIIAAIAASVAEGASGAATAPARSAPRNTARIIDRRRGDDRDRLARGHAVTLEARRDAIHQRIERRIIERCLHPSPAPHARRVRRRGRGSAREASRNRTPASSLRSSLLRLGHSHRDCHTRCSKIYRSVLAVWPNRIFFCSSVIGVSAGRISAPFR